MAGETFDRLIIAKEGWAVPLDAARALEELVKNGEARGVTGRWLSIYSERTSAHGNAYLKAAVDLTGAGEFFLDSADAAEKGSSDGIPPVEKRWSVMVQEARNRAIREGKAKDETVNTIITDAAAVAKSTGHFIPEGSISDLREVIARASAMLASSDLRAGEPKSLSVMLENTLKGFKVARPAAAQFRTALERLTEAEASDLAKALRRLDNKLARLSGNSCKTVYVPDSELSPSGETADAPGSRLGHR